MLKFLGAVEGTGLLQRRISLLKLFCEQTTVHAPREVCWEAGAVEGGDLTVHVQSAYSYSRHIVLQ